MKKFWSLVLGIGLMTALAGIPLSAQTTTPPADNGAGNGNGNGGGRGRGNFDPAARMAQLQKDLGATDDEWKVLEPKIQAVDDLRRAEMMARYGGMGGGRNRNRNGGGGGDNAGGAAGGAAPANPAADNSVAKASADLKTVLENKDATPDQIKEKLAALRDARTKAKDAMTKAQAALKEIITVRQEAVLVSRGTLE